MTQSALDKPAPVGPEELQSWLSSYGLTQEQASELFGTTQPTMSRWLRGQSDTPGCLRHAMTLLSLDPRWVAMAQNQYRRKDFKDYSQQTSGHFFDDFESDWLDSSKSAA
jgi:hypothetical protein